MPKSVKDFELNIIEAINSILFRNSRNLPIKPHQDVITTLKQSDLSNDLKIYLLLVGVEGAIREYLDNDSAWKHYKSNCEKICLLIDEYKLSSKNTKEQDLIKIVRTIEGVVLSNIGFNKQGSYANMCRAIINQCDGYINFSQDFKSLIALDAKLPNLTRIHNI